MDYDWVYFDFDKHWDDFYKVWCTDSVQQALIPGVYEWSDSWKKGDPLWNLGNSDYWAFKAHDRMNASLKAEHGGWDACIRNYRRAIANGCRKTYTSKRAAQHAFCEVVLDKIWNDFEPRNGTVESLIMPDGESLLIPALEEMARRMFPDKEIYVSQLTDYEVPKVLILDDSIVFDLIGFFMWTREANKDYDPANIYIEELDQSDSEADSDDAMSYATQADVGTDFDQCQCSECTEYDDLGHDMELAYWI
jgi:hypothetical protein